MPWLTFFQNSLFVLMLSSAYCVISLLKWTDTDRITTTYWCLLMCACLCSTSHCVARPSIYVFHVYIFIHIVTLREEFGKVSWHPICLTYCIGAMLYRPLCSLLCVLGNVAALCCPARPLRQLPVHFCPSYKHTNKCSCVCMCACLCLFPCVCHFFQCSFWLKFVTQSILDTKHLSLKCLLSDTIHFSSLLCKVWMCGCFGAQIYCDG